MLITIKKRVILITILKKLFCQAYFFIFSLITTAFLSSVFLLIFSLDRTTFWLDIFELFEKRKALKKELNEELIPVAWHPNRWWDW